MTSRIVLTEMVEDNSFANELGVQTLVANAEESAPHNSEDALALAFADEHQSDLRHVAGWSRWFISDGVRWLPDETNAVQDFVRHLCRRQANELTGREGQLLASARTVSAVERWRARTGALLPRRINGTATRM